ncbi:MAG TPA: ABC transporter permease subunit [Methylibium sp.]|uniref:ABC transporter permease n=1 Tax=Methylibium sp. TaxID=2067992 RepID=UPI002DBE4F63|nr:ABC transporter permease subunit [Methylibium sp.]HEU4459498.1 ABC transporter permease subunit [Methylibium sp.]
MRRTLRDAFVVVKKELLDALRDRRTLMVVLLSAVAMGPVLLAALSGIVAAIEERAEQRVVHASGIEHAPTLANYIERQGFRIEPVAPAAGAARRAMPALLIVEPGFEEQLARGEPAEVTVQSDGGQRDSGPDGARLLRLLEGFDRERAALLLAVRGVPPAALRSLDVQQRDLAGTGARGAQFTGMVPFFVIMAVVYGALGAALDTTAGERERGSLEPLLSNPVGPVALVLGKWAAVAAVGLAIAVLSAASFLPAQGLIRSEALRALFQFGPREAVAFVLVLVPLAATVAALLMAVAIRCKSFKEAQAASTGVILAVSLLPLIAVFDQGGGKPWFAWVPALGQHSLMNQVLRGEGLSVAGIAASVLVAAVLVAAGLGYVALRLRQAAVR